MLGIPLFSEAIVGFERRNVGQLLAVDVSRRNGVFAFVHNIEVARKLNEAVF